MNALTLAAAADGDAIADAIRLVGVAAPPGDIVYIHSDHLGAPQKITDDTQTLVWDRVQDPFGRQVSLTSSGGIDTTLRLPGQQFDAETGFHYNVWRDYDPSAGRFIESDPIGIEGGINTFAYAESGPVTRTDRLGLAISSDEDQSNRNSERRMQLCLTPNIGKNECIDTYVDCVQQQWKGNCGDCLLFCTGPNGYWPYGRCHL